MKRLPFLYVLPTLALLIGALGPVIVGSRTLYLLDFLNYHLTVKQGQAKAMVEGYLPLVDSQRAGGQAVVGNLNNVALYPDNLLYLFASPLWALNAHMWLHLLVAPFALYWLAREWGLGNRAAWVAGCLYAVSGYFLSQMNFYNLMAGTALAPALAAASLNTFRSARPARGVVAVGVLWSLLVLGGEPTLGMFALLLAVSACVFRGGGSRRKWVLLGAAIACGSLLALPQVVETLRILPGSYRGARGYSPETRLIRSWDPRYLIEWIVPFFYGPPDFRYWGNRVLGLSTPLYFSLYPGVLSLALVFSARRPHTRFEKWAWATTAVGFLLALGGWNPILFFVYQLPWLSAFRFPIKAWLLLAIGASLLGGVSFERCVLGVESRRLATRLAVLAVIVFSVWIGLILQADEAALTLTEFSGRPTGFGEAEVERWSSSLLASLGLLGGYLVLLALRRRMPRLASPAILWLHVVSQLWLLQPLISTDSTTAYRDPPPALDYVRLGERVAQGCSFKLACDLGGPQDYSDPRMLWVERRAFTELFPFSGVRWGLSYSFDSSPDGLDSMWVHAGNKAFPHLDDASAVRLLALSGVDVLLVNRELGEEALRAVRLRTHLTTAGSGVWIYEILDAAEEAQLVGRVRSGQMRLDQLSGEGVDPRNEVFLPGRAPSWRDGRRGTVKSLAAGREEWIFETQGETEGVLVLTRAFLTLYRASVDGESVTPIVANIGQLAIEVPAGQHRVRLWVDREPFLWSFVGVFVGMLGLVGLAVICRRASASALQHAGPGGESPLNLE